MDQENINRAKELFGELLSSQTDRIARMKAQEPAPDYSSLHQIVIGYIPGDGIGPAIMEQTLRVLRVLLAGPLAAGRVVLREIPSLSIASRMAVMKSIPDDAREALHACHVVLKGPLDNTSCPTLPSSVAAIRRELELSVNLRPVANPLLGYDWVMFRENIEGAYLWGGKGIQVDEDLAVDFVVETRLQSEHVARMAFEYARRHGRKHVTVVTKHNVIKLTDGNLVKVCRKLAQEYPDLSYHESLVDITASKLADPGFHKDIDVMILPNLYGDIISDVAAELCGGVGTAGSANIGSRYALFEGIHGTASRMVRENRAAYANPSSLMKAAAMLLSHIGYQAESERLNRALDICGFTERRLEVTGTPQGAGTAEYTDYILDTAAKLAAGQDK